MEAPNRKTPTNLIEGLAANPTTFDFFRAVRLIEAQNPERPRIGASVDPRQDPVRFGEPPLLGFPRSTIAAFTDRGAQPHRLLVHFMGLFGAHAPLPLHITEYAG